jgi:hypothetical protein
VIHPASAGRGALRLRGHSTRHLARRALLAGSDGRTARHSRDLMMQLKKAETALKKARKLAPKSRFSRDP